MPGSMARGGGFWGGGARSWTQAIRNLSGRGRPSVRSKGAQSHHRRRPAEGTTSLCVDPARFSQLAAFPGKRLLSPCPRRNRPPSRMPPSYCEQDREHRPRTQRSPAPEPNQPPGTPSCTSATTQPWVGHLSYLSSMIEKWEIWAGAGRSKKKKKKKSEKINGFLKAAGS